MHKKLAYLLATVMIMGCLTACKDHEPFETIDPNISATVQETTQETLGPSELEYDYLLVYLDGHQRYYRVYDEHGNLVKDTTLGDNGFTFTYEYDEYGNLISDMKTGQDGESQGGYTRVYDDAGNCLEMTYINPDGSYGTKYVYEYDVYGYLIKETEYNDDGSICQWIEYENDVYGNPVLQKQSNPSGETYEVRNEYEYDSNGNMTQFAFYRGGEYCGRSENTYDEAGRLICEKTFNADGSSKSWVEYSFDENGNMKYKTIFRTDGKVFQSISYEYGYNGYLAVETKYDEDHEIIEMYQYVYYKNEQ